VSVPGERKIGDFFSLCCSRFHLTPIQRGSRRWVGGVWVYPVGDTVATAAAADSIWQPTSMGKMHVNDPCATQTQHHSEKRKRTRLLCPGGGSVAPPRENLHACTKYKNKQRVARPAAVGLISGGAGIFGQVRDRRLYFGTC
jgi:hypothetical protein